MENDDKKGGNEAKDLLKDMGKWMSLFHPVIRLFDRIGRKKEWKALTPGQQWGKFYDMLTPEDVQKIDEGQMTTEQIQELIRRRKGL